MGQDQSIDQKLQQRLKSLHVGIESPGQKLLGKIFFSTCAGFHLIFALTYIRSCPDSGEHSVPM